MCHRGCEWKMVAGVIGHGDSMPTEFPPWDLLMPILGAPRPTSSNVALHYPMNPGILSQMGASARVHEPGTSLHPLILKPRSTHSVSLLRELVRELRRELDVQFGRGQMRSSCSPLVR